MTTLRDQFDTSDASMRAAMQAQGTTQRAAVKDATVQARIAEDAASPGSRALMARLK